MTRGKNRLASPRPCAGCGEQFQPREDQIRRGCGKYCSRRCCSPIVGRQHGRAVTGADLPSEPFELAGRLVCSVPLVPRGTALIDAADRALVSGRSWQLHTGGYAIAHRTKAEGGGRVYMHHLILSIPADREVDHLNHDKLDNRRGNLRAATRSQNELNQWVPQAGNPLGFRNVYRSAGYRRFKAQITVNGKAEKIGLFDTAEEAAAAVARRRAELLGFERIMPIRPTADANGHAPEPDAEGVAA